MRARPMATTGLTGSRAASSLAPGRGSIAASMGVRDSMAADTTGGLDSGRLEDARLQDAGLGLSDAGRWAVSTVASAGASTHSTVEDSTAATRFAAVAAFTVEEVSTVAADSTAAAMAVDTDKFLSSTPPDGRQHSLPAVSFFGVDPAREQNHARTAAKTPRAVMRASWLPYRAW